MVKVDVFELAFLNRIDLAVALVVTATEAPATMTAASPPAGTTPPDQVEAAFQLPPVTVVVLVVPPLLTEAPDMRATSVSKFRHSSRVNLLSHDAFICSASLSMLKLGTCSASRCVSKNRIVQ